MFQIEKRLAKGGQACFNVGPAGERSWEKMRNNGPSALEWPLLKKGRQRRTDRRRMGRTAARLRCRCGNTLS
jgi:hypothetical protein